MPHTICVSTLLVSLRFFCDGRRVQTPSVAQLERNLPAEGDESQSFVEVAASFVPSSPLARLNVLRPRHAGVRAPLMPEATSHLSSPVMSAMDNESITEPTSKHESPIPEMRTESDSSQVSADAFDFGLLAATQVLARTALAVRRRASIVQSNDADTPTKDNSFDISLWVCVVLWYLGNYYYNVTNKVALIAAGGASGFPLTIATCQLGVGCLYAILLWLLPDARPRPTITRKDWLKTLPIGLTSAGQHACAVFALSAGAVSFAQVVKAAEPAFAAVLATILYKHPLSKAKWVCLLILIGGVGIASFGELTFSLVALVTASLANIFAALGKNEIEKLMYMPGLKDRMGSVGNQFAITIINAFVLCVPLVILTEGHKFGAFVQLCKSSPALVKNIIFSGIWCYMYAELATIVIKKTSAVTQSVLTSLKRVIVIVGIGIVMGEHLGRLKLLGCGVAIVAAFLYSVIDRLLSKMNSEDTGKAPETHLRKSKPSMMLPSEVPEGTSIGWGWRSPRKA